MPERTVTFEEIKPAMHKWGSYFCNNRFDKWELINAAWADGAVRFLPESKVRWASARIMWDMQQYMRKRDRLRSRRLTAKSKGCDVVYVNNFTDIGPEDIGFTNLMPAEELDVGAEDVVEFLTSHSSLSMIERLIAKLYYIDGLSSREVGEACGISESRVSQLRTAFVERLKALDLARII